MKKLLAALALSLIALAASRAGTERVDLQPTVKVLVFSTPKPGKWYSRIGTVHSFSDAVIVACFEWKTQTQVECLVIGKGDGETLLVPMYLLEIKT